ncbi:protein unc-13 homolog 4B isoform X7 [Pararge aegeria]|uniref:protein unc-13 homolog 4B isoform X7 n=1 Tax=Pararge aegeria TaxID=116150 RepID=UPI0019D2BD70|nr:protein unc-13 homolog 4B isoform X7 [Pararge aegeria]
MVFSRAGLLRNLSLRLNQSRQMHLLKKNAYINGQWVNAQSKAVFPVLNPADDKVIAEIPDMDAVDAKLAVDTATNTFQTWKDTTAKERATILRRWYDLCVKNSDNLAEIITAEAGKPLSESKGEIVYGSSFLEWFADTARHINGEVVPSPWPHKAIMVTRQPLGVVSVITPWNFPFAMITRKVGALMAAGCTCVIKPSEDTPLTALAAVQLAEEAGVPKGVINVITSSRKNAPAVGKVLCEDPSVGCISFTGSTHVGVILYGMAAKGVKRVCLELGGNAPFIVFPSADISHAVDQAMLAKFRNNGQACVGANRFLVHRDVYDSFVQAFKEKISKGCILGPGTKQGVTCGPLINIEQTKKVTQLVDDALSKGAKALIGGKPAEQLGNKFYESTILTEVKPEMRIYREEIFGPIAVCYKFETEQEAIQVANNTRSGLASYVFTKDLGQAFRMSRQLNFGMVAINDGILSAAEPPFGGIKESGIGREGSKHGAEEYTDIKYTLFAGLDKIQEVDDSFFEKFGSILKQVSQKAALEESTPLAPLKEAEEQDGEQKAIDVSENQSVARDSDSGNETLLDTDSEPEDPEKVDFYVEAVGWNVDELYLEILYEILHNVGGCDVGCEVGQQAMLGYVQEAFKISNDKHTQLLTQAEAKEPPELMLNVEVVEGKDLVPKDPSGLSDPFVTIYLMSNTAHRYNTSVKSGTLNPTWEEHFSLPIPGNLQEDSLCLEVWDFDPAETVKEKMTKIFEVKGVKGLRKLMKEIAITASTGKHDNELIGTANIPLKSIPAGGMMMWLNLSKKSKLRRQGVLKARFSFSSEKNSQVAAQEHRHLLRILLLHELESSKVAPYWWCGNFSAAAEGILTQHAAQSGLSQLDNHLAQWSVFCAITTDHPLSFALFNGLLDKVTKALQSGLVNEEDVKLFWDGAKKLLPTCYSHIRKLRKKTAGDKTVMKTLREVLKILYKLSILDTPESIDLFPANLYGWLRDKDDGTKLTLHEVLNQAVIQGASDWFVHILDNNECKDKSEESRLQHLIRVIQLVRSDLQRAVEYFDRVFVEVMSYQYSRALYGVYEDKIASLVEPEVIQVCKSMKRLRYSEGSTNSVHLAGGLNGDTGLGAPEVGSEPLAMGTTLFELYLALQRFLTLGQGLNETDWNSYSISKFHSWFFGGVAQWLDIAAYKALTRIEKAVELDYLVPVDTNVKYSSSGVDTLAIFYQIKIFWQQLAWPDVEGCYTFVAKIVDDICRCCVFYSDRMANRVSSVGTVSTVYEERFEVTTDWCVAINNIDYVRQSLQPFVEELGMDDIIQKMCETRSPLEAQRCKETLQNVIANAIDTVKNKIVDLLEVMIKKMMPSITRFLIEGAELLHQDCSSMDRVMRYLEANLDTLYQHLNNENFSRTLDIVWEQLGEVLYELIQANLEHRRAKITRYIDPRRLTKSAAANLEAKRRPPSFFSNLHECLKIMVRSFRQDNKDIYTSDTLKRVEYLLNLHGLETRELIHQYHLERWQDQQSITEPKMGLLTVRAQFIEDSLKLEIMNARNLMPTDSNGLCDSYVRAALLPEDAFANVEKPKTQTHSKNLFPLYDEMFLISLNHEQRRIPDGLIHLVIKDKDMFSVSNTFVGEAYLHFSEIPDTPAPISSLPQQHLPLSRPATIDGDAIKALESRQGDKQAREFLKKQRQKMPSKQFFSLG